MKDEKRMTDGGERRRKRRRHGKSRKQLKCDILLSRDEPTEQRRT